jgi:diguanylate cyclase (GGDEF)-like protein
MKDTRHTEQSLRRRAVMLHAFVAAVFVAGAASAACVALATTDRALLGPSTSTALVLVGLLIMGEVRTLKWLKLHDGGEVTTSWAFAFSLLILPAPVLAVAAIALASTTGDVVHRKRLSRIVFNAGQTALSLSAAAAVLLIFGQLDTIGSGSDLSVLWFVAIAAAGSTTFLVNGLATCIVLALHEGTRISTMLRRGLLLNFKSDGALIALAPIFVVVANRSILLLPLVVAVALFVHVNMRAALASEHEANHDVLTELLNRRAFTARLDSEFADSNRVERCGLVLIDLDDFKEINDRLGHHLGDVVLTEVADRLRDLQEPGQVIARLGGDEFAVLCTKVDRVSELMAWAERLRASLSQPLVQCGFPVASSASVGVAVWPDHGHDHDSLLQAADLAMYAAKKTGNAVQMYKESGVGGATGRIDLLSELERGIARNELELWYQPQIDAVTGEPVAFEALLRWRHPRLGVVMPNDFVPLAEHTELIVPLTEYVLDRALIEAGVWQQRHPLVRVAVNVSARNLQDRAFPKAIAAALSRRDFAGSLLELEITENAVMSNPQKVAAVLEVIEQLGVKLSIDDFGTGYSSLASLRDLPVESVKIDRSFVMDLVDHDGDHTIVSAIVDLAHSLGLTTVAEGVESVDAQNRLTQMGCDLLQGYLVAKPMPLREALVWLDRATPNLMRTSIDVAFRSLDKVVRP